MLVMCAPVLGSASGEISSWGLRLHLLAQPAKLCRNKYRCFPTAAEALRFAVEVLRTPKAFGAWLEVGDERFNGTEIQCLYEAADYPLRKSK